MFQIGENADGVGGTTDDPAQTVSVQRAAMNVAGHLPMRDVVGRANSGRTAAVRADPCVLPRLAQ